MATSNSALWITPVVAGLFSLGGVWLGNHLSQQNSFALLQRQKRYESQHSSYSKLMGLKLAWSQAIRTNTEAKLLSEYYDARAHITKSSGDLDEAKRQNDRGIALIPRISDLQREVFESLGDVRLAFESTKELELAIEAIYRYRTIDVKPAWPIVQSVKGLDGWKKENDQRMAQLLKEEYEDKVDNLLSEMLRQLRESPPRF